MNACATIIMTNIKSECLKKMKTISGHRDEKLLFPQQIGACQQYGSGKYLTGPSEA
jgi:hypothetical protein